MIESGATVQISPDALLPGDEGTVTYLRPVDGGRAAEVQFPDGQIMVYPSSMIIES